MTTIPVNKWISSGNDFLKDAVAGTSGTQGLNVSGSETRYTGSLNGLATTTRADGTVLLYTGSSNAGVHLAIYNPNNDSWSEPWTWLSGPGSGYTGTQSIGVLAISDDGRFLAVGQGNPSSYLGLSMPSRGVQIGEIKADGTIQWLPISEGAQAKLNNENIRSLEWVGNTLIATSRNAEFAREFKPDQGKYTPVPKVNGNTLSVTTDATGITEVNKTPLQDEIRLLAKTSGYLLAASHDIKSESRNRVLISSQNDIAIEELKGDEYSKLKQEEWFAAPDNVLARISAHPDLINGKLIAFVGMYNTKKPDDPTDFTGRISEIVRLVIDPVTMNLDSYQHYEVATADIGTKQASNSFLYGLFSFAVDPHDPNGLGVYAGGNLFLKANEPALVDGGGLVKVTFPSSETDGAAQAQISDYLYGPRVSTDSNGTTTTFNPGQPHADSRSIDFYISKNGPRLIQSDDGGVWEINLNNNENTDNYWQPLVGPGLTGLETVMTSWISVNNSILSSYQDNGASLGYLKDNYATNFWNSDGKLVFVDDGSEAGGFSGYLSAQNYLGIGTDSKITRLNFGEEGYVESSDIIDIYYQRSSTSPIIPWEWTEDAQDAREIYPLEVNAFQKGDIVLASASNIYTVVQTDDSRVLPANGLLLKPLLKKNGKNFFVSSLDNQQENLYAATFTVGTDGKINHVIYGDNPNNESPPTLTPVIDFEKVSPDLNSLGAILDIAHQPTMDVNAFYWIQGGQTPRYQLGLPNTTTQYLMVWNPTKQEISKVTLAEINLPTIEAATGQTDQYGYQALCFVPGRGIRNDQLVIGGPLGVFIAELPPNGAISASELTFEEMPFDGMESGQSIGSYIQSIDYDPNDDLLIAGTIGQGSYLYSFSGELGERIYSNQLQVHDITLPMRSVEDLDKRGDEQNSNLVIQIDKAPSQQIDTTLEIVLRDANAWREYMEVVSPFHFNLPDQVDNDDTVEALKSINLLEGEGRKNFGAEIVNNDIIFRVDIPAATAFYALEINQKTFQQSQLPTGNDKNPKLKFSVTDLGYPDATKEATLTLESRSKAERAVTYSPSLLNLELDYLAAIPLGNSLKRSYDGELKKRNTNFNSSNLSSLLYNYSYAKDIKSDNLEESSFRLTVPIDTFSILRTSEELNSNFDTTKWLQALITSDSVETGTNKDFSDKYTYTEEEVQAVGSGAEAQIYDPITQKGARFYDINNDGYADQLSISAPASQAEFTTNVSVGFGSVKLDPIFTSFGQNQVHLHDPINPETTANIRLSVGLVKQGASTSSLGYILLDPSENIDDFSTELFKDRARNLITSLGDWVDLSAVLEGFSFSSEFLANTGQRLLVFEVEGGSLDQLGGLNAPRLSWPTTKLTADGKTLRVSSANGAEVSIAITPGVQDLNTLIADQQNQTPILDFTALASDQSINFTLNYGREAALDSVTGWYVIQSQDGAIAAADGQTLRPGDLNYISEALRSGNRIDTISDLSIANRQTQSVEGEFFGGLFLAPYAKVNNGETYVAFPEANSDNQQHFKVLGENLIGFEDLLNNGDRDLQAFVWEFDFSIGQL